MDPESITVAAEMKLFMVQVYDPDTGQPVSEEIPVMARDAGHANQIVRDRRRREK